MFDPTPSVFDLDEAAPSFVGSVTGLETGVFELLGCHDVELFCTDPPELVQVVPGFYAEFLDCPGTACRDIGISICRVRICDFLPPPNSQSPIALILAPPCTRPAQAPITYRARSPHPVSAAPSCPKKTPKARVLGLSEPSHACSYPALAQAGQTSPPLVQSFSVVF